MCERVKAGWLAVGAALATAAMPTGAAAQYAADWDRLAPSSHWNLDYAEDSCALRRSFGEGDDRTFLELRQFEPEGALQVIVMTKGTQMRSADELLVASHVRSRIARPSVSFLPETEPAEWGQPLGIHSEEWGEGVLFTSLDLRNSEQRELARAFLAEHGTGLVVSDEQRDVREAEIDGLAVENVYRRNFVLDTGAMQAPMSAMRQCMDELIEHWGIDAEANRHLTRRVQPRDFQSWVTRVQQQYPTAMERQNEQAVVRVRLTVSPEGRATDCAVQTDISNPLFDEAACEVLLRHSRFDPALDADGDPIASYWVKTIVYRIGT
ncbi:energy transducer TonB [Aurantiacibacter spongiae]|uniref:energy transducer TonB n=1 Tax=Aurantiacibacter spongiae TaxID=2488860 RepID=UPI001315A81E|nr:energy transducer TonB [Aurantiacibacter spongiae]